MAGGFNPNKFVKDSKEYKDHTIVKVEDVVETKPKRKAKKTDVVPVNNNMSIAPQQSELNLLQSDISYMTAYQETNEQLDSAIQELNMIGSEVMSEFMNIKSSKTLKNKYNYINDMAETVTGVINAKVSIIKEKNKTINDVNNMELRRMKELKLDATKEDDNTKLMNLYDAFVNTPVGSYGSGPNVLGPSITDMTLMGGAPDMNRMSIGNDQSTWEQSLDPAQNRMLLEAKGVVETVVFYDESSGNRWYEVVDINTRQPVPNVEKPDSTNIYDLDINVRGGFAKDTNRNTTYPLVVINGQDNTILDY